MTIKNEFAGYYLMYHFESKSFVLGCTTKLKRRFTEHKRDLKAGKEKNSRFQKLFTENWNIFQKKWQMKISVSKNLLIYFFLRLISMKNTKIQQSLFGLFFNSFLLSISEN